MQIHVNGQPTESSATTLLELLAERKLDAEKLVAELNGEIVPKESFAQTRLSPDDRLELVHFVGGG